MVDSGVQKAAVLMLALGEDEIRDGDLRGDRRHVLVVAIEHRAQIPGQRFRPPPIARHDGHR